MANTETNQDKLKALQLTLDKIEKNFGNPFRLYRATQSLRRGRIPERPCNRNIRSRIFR